MSNLFESSIFETHEKLIRGEITATDLVKYALDQVSEKGDEVRAFVSLRAEEAFEEAKNWDENGIDPDKPLAGIPVAVKDNILTSDLPTTASSKMLENFYSVYDATVIERLKDAGAIIIGKVNLDEFAMGGSTENSAFFDTKNPWDLRRVPGGSSGGSAAVVAARMALASLGTDTGGSIRQPVAYNNLVGMKPTYGTVSRYGVIAFASSLDQVGPMTKTVADNALLLETIAGQDDHDPTSVKRPADYFSQIDAGISGLKIGLPDEMLESSLVSESVKEHILKAVDIFKDLGAEIYDISIPHMRYAPAAYYVISSAEASSNLQRFDGIRYGYRSENAKNLDDIYVQSRSEGFGKEVKARILMGTHILGADHYERFFEKAAKVRTLIRQDFERAFEQVDIVLSPTATTIAPLLESELSDEAIGDPIDAYIDDLLTVSANLAGIPALSVPAGFVKDMPVGIQLMGAHFDEATLYRAGYAFEQATEYYKAVPSFKGGDQ